MKSYYGFEQRLSENVYIVVREDGSYRHKIYKTLIGNH